MSTLIPVFLGVVLLFASAVAVHLSRRSWFRALSGRGLPQSPATLDADQRLGPIVAVAREPWLPTLAVAAVGIVATVAGLRLCWLASSDSRTALGAGAVLAGILFLLAAVHFWHRRLECRELGLRRVNMFGSTELAYEQVRAITVRRLTDGAMVDASVCRWLAELEGDASASDISYQIEVWRGSEDSERGRALVELITRTSEVIGARLAASWTAAGRLQWTERVHLRSDAVVLSDPDGRPHALPFSAVTSLRLDTSKLVATLDPGDVTLVNVAERNAWPLIWLISQRIVNPLTPEALLRT